MTIPKTILRLLPVLLGFNLLGSDAITPYKYTDAEITQAKKDGFSCFDYQIPTACRFTAPRTEQNTPEIIFYLSKPTAASYPIAILCGGSVDQESVRSIIHFHRYFLQECLDLNLGVLTVELWGVDGSKIEPDWINYYTRSQRLADHQAVIKHLKENPPLGWNGKLIFIGVSEGGPLVTSLTEQYGAVTLATMSWSGAGDYSWRDELCDFIQNLKKTLPLFTRILIKLSRWFPVNTNIPKDRSEYDQQMDTILNDPAPDKYFLGMTYKYHADALTYPVTQYEKIVTPFLVVAGAQDSCIKSSDAFVQKAKATGANITYLRIVDMDHYIRRRPEIVAQSFEWLEKEQNKAILSCS